MTSQYSRAPKYPKAPGVTTRYDIAEVTVWLWARLGKLLIPIPIKPSQNATRWRISDMDAQICF